MSAPIEAIEQEIERLEEQAEEIEETYDEYFENVRHGRASGRGTRNTTEYAREALRLRREVLQKYEVWCNRAEGLVLEYLPERTDSFKEARILFKRRIHLDEEFGTNATDWLVNNHDDFDLQRSILKSIPPRIRIEELKVRRQVSKDVSQGELDKARDLFEEGEVRASGVIAGVALERYLLMVCQNSDSDIDYKYNDGIAALAQKLFEADEIDSTPQKHLQHLADIRAGCAHANEEEPDERDVGRLLDDTEDYIRGRKI